MSGAATGDGGHDTGGGMTDAWYDAYCAATDRLSSRGSAAEFHAMGLDADDAARWARFGFTPGAAAGWIADGIDVLAAAAIEHPQEIPPQRLTG